MRLMRTSELLALIPSNARIDAYTITKSMQHIGFCWEEPYTKPITVARIDSSALMPGRILDGIRRIIAADACGITWLPVKVV